MAAAYDNRAESVDRLGSSFHWLNLTQFQGALNDNIYKLLVTFFLIRNLGADQASMLSGLGGIVFALPFILFVPAAGVLADRISKSRIVVAAKIAETAVMALACLFFWLAPPWAGFVILFLMATQSALFAPTKYGIVPELVQPHQLSRANGYLVAMTYMSIILGTAAAPWITDNLIGREITDNRGGAFASAALICVVIAATGTLTSLGMRRTEAMASPRRISFRFWNDVLATWRANRHDRFLVLAVLAASYFSLIGAFIQLNLIPYALVHLGLGETAGGYLFLFAAFGIGAGSLLAGRLSGRNIEFGMIPVGAMLIALSTLLLFLLPYGVGTTRILIFMAGVGAGLFIIPIEAFIQFRAPKDQMGSVMAANGFLSWTGVLFAGLLIFGLSFIPSWKPSYTFALIGGLTLALTAVCLRMLPDFFVRFAGMVLTRSVYRIRRVGLENLPLEGGGLLVANHVSCMDALLILACQQRRIRFLMDRSIYERHPLRFLFRLMHVIPISEKDNPRDLLQAFLEARREMDEGYLVCIFAEGALTRTGQMRAFKGGMERILRDTSYPVIPVHIGGVWGSRFSHFRTILAGKPAPIRWRYPVTIVFGMAMPSSTRAWQAHDAVRELSAVHFDVRKGPDRHIGRALVRSARKYRRLPALYDTTGRSLRYGQMLTAAVALSRALRRRLGSEDHVGVILPPSVGGILVNMALVLCGKVPVNLNFTVSAGAFSSALKQAGIATVITAGAMREKIPDLPLPRQVLHVEDLLGGLGAGQKLVAFLLAWFAPVRLLVPPAREQGDDLLTIMFSSGTTGEPKGVMLSHHNILSNVEALVEVFRPDPELHLCATLPIFHSFGFTAGIWFPLLCGMQVSCHVSPLDTARVIRMIRERRCNTLFTTPTFLSSYLRKAEPSDLASLKFVVVGAEKLKRHLADLYEAKFGVRPLEGYGTTEMAPVVALNLPDAEGPGPGQIGNKHGSIGQPLPGMAVRVVHSDNGEILAPGQEGLLVVRGPNLMTGYLGQPELTGQSVREGWYFTGDIARMDEDGFLYITGRLQRFSKIGGEMVPHMAAEELLASRLKLEELALAVTAVPDEKKGERLALLYTGAAGDPKRFKELLDQSDLPNLWCPAEAMFFRVDSLPLTATGKLDVKKVRQVALECAGLLRP